MTNAKSINHKVERLAELGKLVEKIDVACLGEEPQMRKEMQKIRKIAIEQMRTLKAELDKFAKEQTKADSAVEPLI